MIRKIQREKGLFFSYDYNLTKSAQTNINEIVDRKAFTGFWEELTKEFVFNSNFIKFSSDVNALKDYLIPVVYGNIFIRVCEKESKKMNYALISRKDCRRLGKRFTCRGATEDGSVVNYVETEQIMSDYDGQNYRVAAYLQTRGSIPIKWTQTPTLKWAPKLKMSPDDETNFKFLKTHLDREVEKYGENVLVNLIDKKGSQLQIGTKFTDMVNRYKNPKITYEWFDFHHECRKMRWENLKILIDKIKDKMNSFDYFMA